MRLAATLTLYGGGPGSGCKGPHCGRPQTVFHGTVLDTARDIVRKGIKPNPGRQFAVGNIPMEKGYVYATTDHDQAVMYANIRAAYEKSPPNSFFRYDDAHGVANVMPKSDQGANDMNWMLRSNPELARGAFTPAIVTLNLPEEVVNKLEHDPDSGEPEEDEEMKAFRTKGIFPAKYIAKVEVKREDGWHEYKPEEIKNLEAQAFRQVHFVYFGPVDGLREHLLMGGQVDDYGNQESAN